jgi:hypothetical protein
MTTTNLVFHKVNRGDEEFCLMFSGEGEDTYFCDDMRLFTLFTAFEGMVKLARWVLDTGIPSGKVSKKTFSEMEENIPEGLEALEQITAEEAKAYYEEVSREALTQKMKDDLTFSFVKDAEGDVGFSVLFSSGRRLSLVSNTTSAAQNGVPVEYLQKQFIKNFLTDPLACFTADFDPDNETLISDGEAKEIWLAAGGSTVNS